MGNASPRKLKNKNSEGVITEEVQYKVEDKSTKILVLGDGGSGKRSLVSRIIEGEFRETDHDFTPKTKDIKDSNGRMIIRLKFYCCDPLLNINSRHYDDVKIILLCCNINGQDPLEQLSSWKWELDRNIKDKKLHVIICCTMYDNWTNSVGSSGFNFNDIVSKAKEFSDDNFIYDVIKLSSKTGEGIDELMNKIVNLTSNMCL